MALCGAWNGNSVARRVVATGGLATVIAGDRNDPGSSSLPHLTLEGLALLYQRNPSPRTAHRPPLYPREEGSEKQSFSFFPVDFPSRVAISLPIRWING